MLHVCSLSRLNETVTKVGAGHLVTLINADADVPTPDCILPERHLFLGLNDIAIPIDGLVPPAEAHVHQLLDFAGTWNRKSPMVVHCWAGISRSTAGAYITACALNPDWNERELAQELRRRAPSATPNGRLVAMADKILARQGRMIEAIREIGRGATAFEGTPFEMPIS
ncbi:tyrosine phosphatase family protein [Roseibium algae]|uniref:Tyrosine phosphatase family protein n=1 Tax=Roseibium algae TaxID=3123038 RepID=A0ABU8THY7_9HYPH